MKIQATFIGIFLMLATIYPSDGNANKATFKGPYVGQKTPGSIPQPFAPNGHSTEYRDGSGFFSPDMTEFYFTRKNNKDGKWSLMVFKSKDNHWHESVVGLGLELGV